MWPFLQVVATTLKDHVPHLHISFIVFCHSEDCFNLEPYHHFNLRVCLVWLLCTKSSVKCLQSSSETDWRCMKLGAWVTTLLFSNCCAFAACHHHLQVCSNSWCAVSATHCMPDAGEAPEANHISGCSLFFLRIQSHCYHRMRAAKIWGSNQSPYKRAQGMLHLASDSISPPTAIQHFLLEQPDELKLHTFLYLRSAQGGKNN